jgi:hypothetical protein
MARRPSLLGQENAGRARNINYVSIVLIYLERIQSFVVAPIPLTEI